MFQHSFDRTPDTSINILNDSEEYLYGKYKQKDKNGSIKTFKLSDILSEYESKLPQS